MIKCLIFTPWPDFYVSLGQHLPKPNQWELLLEHNLFISLLFNNNGLELVSPILLFMCTVCVVNFCHCRFSQDFHDAFKGSPRE